MAHCVDRAAIEARCVGLSAGENEVQREHGRIGIHVNTLDAFECLGHRAVQLSPQAKRKRLVRNLPQRGPLEPDMAVWIMREHAAEP